ncbi:MAG TPA: ABC transporter substrate-binding protein [Candidatus Limnocylindria bacterium]|nr:ABC transporter substrate-binding protein [Candidatus Limnocylindria bacterium]
MRIVSLVPAATEIACAIGAGDDLVAVTHDCDFPPAVRALPRITRSTIEPGTRSGAIDAQVRAAADRGESTFHLDAAALAGARPDVLLGQTLCAVCAVTLDALPASLDPAPRVVPLDGESIAGIYTDIVRVGDAIDRRAAADALVARLRERVAQVRERVAGLQRPRVACLEWLDPLFNAGHWVPEQVDLAGGVDVLGEPGARSRVVTQATVSAADPDVLLLMPCGFDAERAHTEAGELLRGTDWSSLRAVREGRAFALDGNAYFSRPGPRVVDGIELLASLLHPDRARPATPRALSFAP